MPPIKSTKKCCVPHCANIRDVSKKQFFRIGANVETRNKWRPEKNLTTKSQIMYCCEDHFDLPDEAVNYIRYKYCPNTKLRLRQNVLPHKKLPINVCRLCLKLIYNEDNFIDISKTKGEANAKIVTCSLPEIDLSLTVEPVACWKCFNPLEKYYKIKQDVLRNEIAIVSCIKSIAKEAPKRLLKNCEIDLFDEYNDIKDLLNHEEEKSELIIDTPNSTLRSEIVAEDGNNKVDNGVENESKIMIEIDQAESDIDQIKQSDENSVKPNQTINALSPYRNRQGEMQYEISDETSDNDCKIEQIPLE